MPSRNCSDPFYLSDAAQWVMRRVTGTGVDVDVIDNLQVPGYSSRADGRIWVRSGLQFPEYHWLMAKGLIHQLFGLDAPNTAPVGPDMRQVARNAQVIPLQRPPFTSGQWR